jgi:hypothetical protein
LAFLLKRVKFFYEETLKASQYLIGNGVDVIEKEGII